MKKEKLNKAAKKAVKDLTNLSEMMNFNFMWELSRDSIRTQEYVENECRKIVDQILEEK